MPFDTKINGDLTKCDSDAIVNSLGVNGSVYGKICEDIVNKANSLELKNFIDSKVNQKVGTIYVTEGYDLPSKNIIHIVTPFKREDKNNNLLIKAYRDVINKAIELGCDSISLPFLGTGANGYSESDAYNSVMEVVGEILYKEELENRDIISIILMIYFPKKRCNGREMNELERYRLSSRKFLDSEIIECKSLRAPLPYDLKFVELLNLNGPVTFESLYKIPSIDIFKGYRKKFQKKLDDDFTVRMAKIEKLYSMVDPNDFMEPMNKHYQAPLDFVYDYLAQIGVPSTILNKGGMDRRQKIRLAKQKSLNKVDRLKIIYLVKFTPSIALEYIMFTNGSINPQSDVDMLLVDYLLGILGKVETAYDLTSIAFERGIEEELYFKKYNKKDD